MTAEGDLKLSDFGLATVYVGTSKSYSHQVATRWYRAPELLLGGREYDFAVDMWAVGTVLAELLHLVPLFPGQSDIDQLVRIFQVLGSPEKLWPVKSRIAWSLSSCRADRLHCSSRTRPNCPTFIRSSSRRTSPCHGVACSRIRPTMHWTSSVSYSCSTRPSG